MFSQSLLPLWRLCLLVGIVFLAGCQIQGRVLVDGVGVPDQIVHLVGEGLDISTRTDAQGRYAFKDIGAGYYRVSLERQGSIVKRVQKLSGRSSLNHVDFEVDSRTRRELTTGTVTGRVDTNGTLVWRGIPYASPPQGDLRWRAARPAVSWQGDYWALESSEPCPQIAHLQIDIPINQIGSVTGREDCLYLNVWTPGFDALALDSRPRPVMFWIHGGGNTAGEAAIFDGKVLAEKYGVIVVTVNYRLGVLGYFSHPALRESAPEPIDQTANFALTDLIMSLRWVQDNIAVFGGDPSRVTIFGESAGAFNVGALLASPYASGLFHGAIMQSGGFSWSTRTGSEAFREEGGTQWSSREVINKLLIADGNAVDRDSAKILQQAMSGQEIEQYLRGKSIGQLLEHFDGASFGMYAHPELIRDDVMIPDQDPYQLFRSGAFNRVPVITGTNRDENKIFMAFDPEYMVAGLPLFIKDPQYYELAAYYRTRYWRANAVDRFVAAVSPHVPAVYAYRFDWDEQPKVLWNDLSRLIGAAHFFEVPFVFNTPDVFTVELASPIVFSAAAREGRQQLADSMSSYWAQFAYGGSPANGFGQSESVLWSEAVDGETASNTIVFDTPSDGGVRMEEQAVSYEQLQQALQNETSFRNLGQQCETYRRTYGNDAWFSQHCVGL